jgi:hypothetical protein
MDREDRPQSFAGEGRGSEDPLPGLGRRVLDAFFSPGRLAEALARNPVWGAALGIVLLLGTIQLLLIPAEIWDQYIREAALERGGEVPPWMGTFMRYFRVVGAPVAITIYIFVKGGFTALLFAFVLGDDGRFRQYLAMVVHSQLVPMAISVLLVYPRIVTGNVELTLNVGSFFFFLPEGYWTRMLGALDLTQLWAWIIVAHGAHAIDPRRSLKSGSLVLLAWAVFVAMLLGFLPR